MPGQLKIGKTKDPESRATPFVIEALFKVKDRAKAEVAVHRKLKSYRVAENREFFKCDLKQLFMRLMPFSGRGGSLYLLKTVMRWPPRLSADGRRK